MVQQILKTLKRSNTSAMTRKSSTRKLGATSTIESSARSSAKGKASRDVFLPKIKLYSKVPIQPYAETSPGSHRSKSDESKHTHTQYEVRLKARRGLVANSLKRWADSDLYTAPPPIDSPRVSVSIAASWISISGGRKRVMIIHIARAYFSAPSLQPTCVDICEEDFVERYVDRCGELVVSMHATRRVAQHWQKPSSQFVLTAAPKAIGHQLAYSTQ